MTPAAIFLDRDGTINYDYGYLGNKDKVEILPGVIEGMLKLQESLPDIRFIVISNQAGVARGIISLEQVKEVNGRIQEILEENGVIISKFYYCPFHPEFSNEDESQCRKPSPQMLIEAAGDFNIDLKNTFFVGDRFSDVECGYNAGTKTILLKSDIYSDEETILEQKGINPDFVAENFLDAVNYILSEANGGN
jgi:histidinol-phosphate phosphatase family protein